MVLRKKASQIAHDCKKQPQYNRRLRLSCYYTFIVLLVSLIVVACSQDPKTALPPVNDSPSNSTVLSIWWDKGYILEEDEALQQVVSQWEKQTGNTVKLSFYTSDELSQKAQRAIQAGNPPDVLMNDNADRVLNPRLAWEGK